jgi:DNA (cytosine-5)-methyltransferase 1
MTIEVVDLFAGPGGLSEGFRSAGVDLGGLLRIGLSVEMNPYAVATLRQRALSAHQESSHVVRKHLRLVEGTVVAPDWDEILPTEWSRVLGEVQMLELGTSEADEVVYPRLREIRERANGNSILIGGPPCQAYSIVGRSRNQGNSNYVPENDGRHYLYREYVRILSELRPAIFVMENVKGILSSTVAGELIFQQILDDLSRAADGYHLLPLTIPVDLSRELKSRDFIVRAEHHGVPQARHRVIIFGIRSDMAGCLPHGDILLPETTRERPVAVSEALAGLPPLRSGLSRRDDLSKWAMTIREAIGKFRSCSGVCEELLMVVDDVEARFLANMPRERFSHTSQAPGNLMPRPLVEWLGATASNHLANHEARGHMKSDLERYLFSSAFAVAFERSARLPDFPEYLRPNHRNRDSGKFIDRFRVQLSDRAATTVTSHISKDGHYFIHPDPVQCRSLTVREAARLQTFPDDYVFMGPRTEQFRQVGNAVPPLLARKIADAALGILLGKASQELPVNRAVSFA